MFVIYSLGVGGAERALVNIIKNLDKNKFFPQLVLLAKDTTFKTELSEDIPITKLGIEGRLATLRMIIPLAKVINRKKPKIIISFMWGANLIVLLTNFFMRLSTKIILCERIHAGEDIKNYRFSSIKKILIENFYPKADAIVAVSYGIKKNLTEEFKIPESKIKVIYNGIDLKHIESLASVSFQPPFKKYIIAVGRLEKQKNYPLLLKIFAKVSKEHNIGLVILGEGKERKNLTILVRDLKLNGKVLMPGAVSNPFVWLASGTVFVLCSKYEGFPNVLLEAMACKIPAVSTRCPTGPEEIITDGQTGLLVENNNAEKLEEVILKLLNNPSLGEKLVKQAFEEVKRWDIKRITKEYESLL